MANYYEVLGIKRDVDHKVMRQAFRRLARKYHPDLNPGNSEAEDKFKSVNLAYEVLSDPEKRRKYDRYGDNWKVADQIENQPRESPFRWTRRKNYSQQGTNQDLFGNWSNLFEGFGGISENRGGVSNSKRLQSAVQVTLEEAFQGTLRRVSITQNGRDSKIEVAIPPGVHSGSTVRVALKNQRELFLKITVLPHQRFKQSGSNLETDVVVPFEDAVLGGEIDIPTLSGTIRVKIPVESQNGQRIRLTGQGMPKLGDEKFRGDLIVKLRPTMPSDLTDEEKKLIRKLQKLRLKKE